MRTAVEQPVVIPDGVDDVITVNRATEVFDQITVAVRVVNK